MEVKKIKVISDKSAITWSNFEQPRHTGWKFDTNCNVTVSKRVTAMSEYIVLCVLFRP
jgi:hypothetical protein